MNTFSKWNFLLVLMLLQFAFANAQDEFRVMSYNIRLASANDGPNNWDIRKDKLTDLITYYNPSFLGIQEAQKKQIDYILEKATDFELVGKPREKGIFAEYSAILFNKEAYKVIEESTFWLSSTPDSISIGWDAVCPRIVTYCLLEDLKTASKIWVLNTHFDHVGKKARAESIKLLLAKIEELNRKVPAPIIITGDFNALPEDEIIKKMKLQLHEASEKSIEKPYNPLATFNGFDFTTEPSKQIDYIFFSSNSPLSVKKFSTITDSYHFKYPSDHFPIMATFLWNKQQTN